MIFFAYLFNDIIRLTRTHKMADKISICAKTLSGELYQLEVDSKATSSHISEMMCSSFPNIFPKGLTKVVRDETKPLSDDEIMTILVVPEKNVSLKKIFTRDNSKCIYLGVKLFSCIQNVRFYEEGERTYDIDMEELEKLYLSYYPGTLIRGPEKLGIDSNRLNIMKKNETSTDYACSMGNFGTVSRGSDLKTVLSSTFKQSICHIGNGKPGIPHYVMEFEFKPDVVESILRICENRF